MKSLKQKIMSYVAVSLLLGFSLGGLAGLLPAVTGVSPATASAATSTTENCDELALSQGVSNSSCGSGGCDTSDPSSCCTSDGDSTCIPAGCPGSDQAAPSGFDSSKTCGNIPAGCPGSTAANTDTTPAPATCPYLSYTLQTETPTEQSAGKYYCGSGDNAVAMSISIGCKGQSCTNVEGGKTVTDCSAVLDATFAIIRFLSNGVGLVVIGSIILGGIQYSASRGDPRATAEAVKRIRSSVVALIIFIFGYAILNYIIPSGFFQ